MLRGLAVGVWREPNDSVGELRRVGDLVRDGGLEAPALAGFLDKALLPPPGTEVTIRNRASAEDVPRLRELAARLLALYAERPDEARTMRIGQDENQALQYAEALLLQEHARAALRAASEDSESIHAILDGTDRTRIDSFSTYWGVRGLFRTLDARLESWERFTVHLRDRGSSFEPEEFDNALDGRDILSDALTLLSPAGRPALSDRLSAADATFDAATVELTAPLRKRLRWRPQPWWRFRAPAQPSESFRAMLRRVASEAPSN